LYSRKGLGVSLIWWRLERSWRSIQLAVRLARCKRPSWNRILCHQWLACASFGDNQFLWSTTPATCKTCTQRRMLQSRRIRTRRSCSPARSKSLFSLSTLMIRTTSRSVRTWAVRSLSPDLLRWLKSWRRQPWRKSSCSSNHQTSTITTWLISLCPFRERSSSTSLLESNTRRGEFLSRKMTEP